MLIILDWASIFESYDSHSKYQAAVYQKTVIYMNLNIFVIPVLTLSSGGKTLWELFNGSNWNLAMLLSELFIPKVGEFFIYLVVQSGTINIIYYSLNMSDIIFSFGLPSFNFERRKIYNDSAPWRRHEQNSFLYGYFSAYTMTVFTICTFYAPTVPLIPIAAALFLRMRHYVDGYNLLTYNRREIESSGKLIDYVTNTALIIVTIYQVCMSAYFMTHGRKIESIVCSIIVIVSVFFMVLTYENVFDLIELEQNME